VKYKPYPKYKPSGAEWLGDVPEGWKISRLKNVAEFRYGDSLSAETRIDGEVSVYGSNGAVGTHSVANTLAPTIVIGRKGSFGKITYSDHPAFAIDTTYFVDRRCTGSDLRWLFYGLQTLKLDVFSQDTGVPGLSREDAYQRPLAVPSLNEQSIIATFLDRETAKIDTLIAKQEKLIELLKEKRQAVISHAVTKGLDSTVPMKPSGAEWLGDVPEHWTVAPLKRFVKQIPGAIKTGPFGSQLTSDEMQSGAFKVYNQRSIIDVDFESGENYISDQKFHDLRAFEIFAGDVLVTTRGTIGRAAIFPKNVPRGILHPCLLRIQVDSNILLDDFLLIIIQDSFLLKHQIKLFSNSTTIDVIYSETMASVVLPLPPKSEQLRITAYLHNSTRKINNLIAKAQQAITLQKEHRTALISAAVTGKIDVRGEVETRQAA